MRSVRVAPLQGLDSDHPRRLEHGRQLRDACERALGAGREWFKPWRTIAGEVLADTHLPELQVVIEGLCHKQRFLDLIRDFIVFEDDGGRLSKKMAGFHQFHAVHAAVAETLRAAEMGRAASDDEGRHGGKPGTEGSVSSGIPRARARA